VARATFQITTQAQVDTAPVINGVNIALRDDGTPKSQVRIPVTDYPGLALQLTPTNRHPRPLPLQPLLVLPPVGHSSRGLALPIPSPWWPLKRVPLVLTHYRPFMTLNGPLQALTPIFYCSVKKP